MTNKHRKLVASQGQEVEPCAVLDLGSNSFHMLIGRLDGDRIVTVDRRKDMVRLAQGLDENNNLSVEAQQRALESLTVFAQQIRKIPKERVRVVGTNTLRAAHNSDAFLEQCEKIIGVPLDIISGHEEGRLIFRGVVKGHAGDGKRRLVVDIGGGSTEFIVGRKRAKHVESKFIGCVSLSQKYFGDGKMSPQRYQKALLHAQSEIQPLMDVYGAGRWDEAVGTSGTIRYVGAAVDKLAPSDHLITRDGLDAVAARVASSRKLSSLSELGLSGDRLPVFPGGLAILHAAFIELGIKEMHVSDYALKEGVLYELADHDVFENTRRKTLDYLSRQFKIDRKQARRVERLAMQLLPQVRDRLTTDYEIAKQALRDAAALHELGLTIAHSGYQKHGSYVIENADMPGFSRREQKLLGFLVLNHRRKLRSPAVNAYRFKADWVLVMVLRLSCLLNRGRVEQRLPTLRLEPKRGAIALHIPAAWLARHPLVVEDLESECKLLQSVGLRLDVVQS